MVKMILAGDIGGTKTNLALFSENTTDYSFTHFQSYISKQYSGLEDIVTEYLKSNALENPLTASFAIAGPVHKGVCKTTNLPWIVDVNVLSKNLKIPNVRLLNDLEANAYSIDILEKGSILTLYQGHGHHEGNRAVISPGTGLGEAGLYWDGKKHRPFASEGGHCEFGPRDDMQTELCRYLYQKFGHASYERVLSGPGLVNVYLFFRDIKKREEPKWLKDEMEKQDPAKVITFNALNGKSALCKESLDLFVSILGAEAGNCALKYLAVGGVFLGGGIPPKILSILQEPIFLEGFKDKGRLSDFVSKIPIFVILDDKASLKGAVAAILPY